MAGTIQAMIIGTLIEILLGWARDLLLSILGRHMEEGLEAVIKRLRSRRRRSDPTTTEPAASRTVHDRK